MIYQLFTCSVGMARKCRNVDQPFHERMSPNSTLLKNECHQLLGKNVDRASVGLYRFDVSTAPEFQ